jgi:hypothetical protein
MSTPTGNESGSAERAAALVRWWVAVYTRRLPVAVAERRVGEIEADLADQIADERAQGRADRHIALAVVSRMLRGLPADASWHNRIRPWRGDTVRMFALMLAVALGMVTLGLAAALYGGSDDAPGLVLIGLLLILGACVLSMRAGYRRARGRSESGQT